MVCAGSILSSPEMSFVRSMFRRTFRNALAASCGPSIDAMMRRITMRDAVHDPIGYLAHKLWRIIFFPIAMLALLMMGGVRGLVTFAAFALIVVALRLITLPSHD
jgi:hypothetical protein